MFFKSIKLIAISSIFLISACSGGGDSGTSGSAVTLSADMQMLQLQSNLKVYDGSEFAAGPIPFTGGQASLLGMVFCQPLDPNAPPATTATAANTLYGCQNNVMVTQQISQDLTSISITITIPSIYVDLEGSISSTTVSGYANASNVVVTVVIAITEVAPGEYQYGSVLSSSLTYDAADMFIDTTNLTIQGLFNTYKQSLIDNAKIELENYFSDEVSVFTVNYPKFKTN